MAGGRTRQGCPNHRPPRASPSLALPRGRPRPWLGRGGASRSHAAKIAPCRNGPALSILNFQFTHRALYSARLTSLSTRQTTRDSLKRGGRQVSGHMCLRMMSRSRAFTAKSLSALTRAMRGCPGHGIFRGPARADRGGASLRGISRAC